MTLSLSIWYWATRALLRRITDWLADARWYTTDVIRGRGRGTGLHVLPAGENPEPAPVLRPLPPQPHSYAPTPVHQWAAQAWREIGAVPWQRDSLDDLVDGLELPLEASLRDGQTGVRDLDSPAATRSPESGSLMPRTDGGTPVSVTAGRATSNQRMALWDARDVIPASVIHALTRTGAEDTVVRMSDLEPMVGGDVYDGRGQRGYLAAFDRITDRAHAQIAAARLTLTQIGAGA